MIGPDRIRDEDFAELCRVERGDPPPKPAEPQNRIYKTDWLGVDYPAPPAWSHRRRQAAAQLAIIGLLFVALLALMLLT